MVRATVLCSILAGLLVGAPAASAQTYYLHENMTQGNGQTWTELSRWWSDPVGGTNPTTLNNATLDQNGWDLRTGNTAVTLGNSGTSMKFNDRLILRSSGATIATASSEGPNVLFDAGSGSVKLTLGTYVNNGTTTIRADGSDRTLELSVGTLSGNGDIIINTGGGNTLFAKLSVTEGATDFTGTLGFSGSNTSSTLEFTTDLITSGSLVVSETARIILHQDLRFDHGKIGNDILPAGTFDFNWLNSHYDNIFVDGGSGSITIVVPEPAGVGLLAAGAVLALRRRRRAA